jgi:hypothetical protein
MVHTLSRRLGGWGLELDTVNTGSWQPTRGGSGVGQGFHFSSDVQQLWVSRSSVTFGIGVGPSMGTCGVEQTEIGRSFEERSFRRDQDRLRSGLSTVSPLSRSQNVKIRALLKWF